MPSAAVPSDGDLAITRYEAGACSLVVLARALGVSRQAARGELIRRGIPVRRPGRPAGSSRLAGVLTGDFLRAEVLDRRRAVGELAADLGCTPKTVRRYMVERGIAEPVVLDAPRARPEPTPAPSSGTGLSRDALWEAYVVQGGSTTAIAAARGCAASTVARELRRHGIPLRRRGGAPPPSVRRRIRRAGIRRAVMRADS